ncbi:protein-tyrosine-phosphatase [Lewinella sp. 4G2]|uniref:protein-tyrosine-phosphatase n=1 Tax=Lewinella sp. 4G2 TaxID=1803372 RepID=UPI0009ED7E39|nr:protein-tyrosine-phosphatase [Lewinella sp. 4G2]
MANPQLTQTITQLKSETDLIPPARKQTLERLADYIRQQKQRGAVHLNFICTHNSRRSHLAMIWAAVAAAEYGLEGVHTYSGGTEATAFNSRAVAALERIGFRVDKPGGDNPRYAVRFSDEQPALICYSKTFDDPANPIKDFAAIMTCSDADENCPFIPGVDLRLPLTYEDPKTADDTPKEGERYEERAWQIGRELLYAFALV